jgi:hypothetical protein
MVIYPNLGEPIRKSRQKTVPFYIVVLPGGAAPKATLEIMKDGQPLAQVPTPLTAPDASRRGQKPRNRAGRQRPALAASLPRSFCSDGDSKVTGETERAS